MGLFLLLPITSIAADSSANLHIQILAASCAACHGTNGNSVGGIPVLAGLDKSYFITRMQAFRSGERASTVMHHHAKGLTTEEIEQLALYFLTYESQARPNVHIVGDAVSAVLPKSAHIATSQAKVCASAIVAMMSGNLPDPAPVFANTCYSFVSGKMAMHVAHVYRYDPLKNMLVPAEGGGVSDKPSELEGSYAQSWARNIWSDVLT